MSVIDEKTLTRLHDMQLECMDEIHEICASEKIEYFLDSGTALGAIRHKGFIPWDDDIDIGMMRQDYERFLQSASSRLSKKYFLQTYESEPEYANFHAKIRIEGTFYPQDYTVSFKHRGIQLDFFPFDYLPDNRLAAILYIHYVRFLRRICDLRARELQDSYGLLKKCIYYSVRIISLQRYRSYFEKCCRRFNGRKTENVTCFSYRMSRTRNLIFKAEDMIPTKEIRFEDRQYRIMNNPDHYLSEMYGDYMSLPPEDKRVCHINGTIIFDTSSDE